MTLNDLLYINQFFKLFKHCTIILYIMAQKEIWKKLPAYLKLSKYNASNLGNIKNIITGKLFDMINRKKTNWGYLKVKLTNDDGKETGYNVHILIAEAFHTKPKGNVTVDHINRIKHDNRSENLRWATASEQGMNKSKVIEKFSRKVLQYDLNMNLIKEWSGIPEILKSINNVKKRALYNACSKSIKYINYYWKFKDMIPLEGEEWSEITINKTKIKASNLGRVMTNIKTGVIIDSSHLKNPKQYLKLHIKKKGFYAHRLIMVAFRNFDYDSDFVVNHIDGNYHNNKLSNLEIITQAENAQHAANVLGVYDESNKLNSKKVARLNENGEIDVLYDSLTIAAKENELQISKISCVCNGKRITTGGYKWKFVDN
jgi:hypothetical protein